MLVNVNVFISICPQSEIIFHEVFSYLADPLPCGVMPTCVSRYRLLRVSVRDASQYQVRLCGGGVTPAEDQATGVFHLSAGQQLGCQLAIRLPYTPSQLWTMPCIPENNRQPGLNTNSSIISAGSNKI